MNPVPRVPAQRYTVFLTLTALGLAWDLWTKWWAFGTFGFPRSLDDPQHVSEPWFEWLWGPKVLFISTHFNCGALWGLGQGFSWLFASLSIIAGLGILYWLFVCRAAHSLWLTVSLGFVMAGTLGNLFDRLGLHGLTDERGAVICCVRDFIYFRIINWPIFNFADSFLVTGAIMLVLQAFWQDNPPRKLPASAPSTENSVSV